VKSINTLFGQNVDQMIVEAGDNISVQLDFEWLMRKQTTDREPRFPSRIAE
jgi:hypothetical protein